MNFENQSGFRSNCFRVIIECRFICGANFAQFRAGRFDNFTDAKAAADLDHFAA